jgi:hypothetical protein
MLLAILLLLVTNCLLLNGILILFRRDRDQRKIFEQVTFNQLCSANQRMGAVISMLGYRLSDVERFAKESVCEQAHFMEGRDAGLGPVTAAFIPNPDVVPPLERLKEKPEGKPE